MNQVSIVILNYDRWSLVHQLLMDIYQKCSKELIKEVLVVNNGCTQDESFTGLNWWMGTKMLPIRELRLEENLGFIGGFNAGLKEAKGEILIAISNDVRIHQDVVKQICGYDPLELLLIGGRLLDWNTGWNEFNGRVFPYLEGWLLAAHRDVWKSIGYFDEQYGTNDMEDVDVSTTAFSLGYTLVPLPEGYATHLGAQTYGYTPEREQITIKNKEKFRQKWVLKKDNHS